MTGLARGVSRLAGLIVALAAVGPHAWAAPADKVFTIANYPVEATAKDAVAAKEKAHAEGQQAALGALLKRLVPVTAYNRIDALKWLRAADFVDGVAIRSETNSSTRYIASLDFAFQPAAIRDMLQREGVPFVEQQAPRMVLVPITATADGKGGATYTAATGSWAQVWKGLDLDNTLTPLRIEALLPSIQTDAIRATLSGDDSSEQILSTEYKADFVLLAVAEVDAGGKELNVTLAGIDPAGLMSWRRTYRAADGDVAYAMELAAVITQGVLEGRWKVAKMEGGAGVAGGGAGGGVVHMAVEFSSLGEWNDLRGRLLDLPGIDDVRIGAVSAQSADVSVRYPGGGAGLASVLAQQGLSLSGSGGSWVLRSGY